MKRKESQSYDRPPPVHVVFGKDEFLRSRRLKRLMKELLGEHDESMSVGLFDGSSAQLVDILDDLRTPSMFSPIRVVCVRDADDLFVKDGDDSASPSPKSTAAKSARGRSAVPRAMSARELLEKYLENPCDTGILVFECKSWPKTTRLYKVVDRIGRNIDCDPPKGEQFVSWVRQHARDEFGCVFAGEAASLLVELVGETPGLLHMEISKLADYAHPRKEIRASDIELLVGEARTEIVFKLMDALTIGDAAGTLKMWHQVLAGGKGAEFMALGGLRFAFERLYNAKRMHSRGASARDIKSALRIWDPADMLPRQLSRFTLPQSRSMLTGLLRIDLNSKSGLGTVQSSVEKLIVELCAAS
ncbi:MAG: DNA polymerase III subunit delta [Phycisphaerae bacterium]|nr:DNA polymerase III subunit delta [Phycisphaerae bacterium]